MSKLKKLMIVLSPLLAPAAFIALYYLGLAFQKWHLLELINYGR